MDKANEAARPRLRWGVVTRWKQVFRGRAALRLAVRLAILGTFGAAGAAAFGLWGGGAEAGRFLPTVENPYCDVTTYTLRDVAEQATSMLDTRGRPVIVVNYQMLREQPAYSRFLMAHECCHHSLGHVGKYRQEMGHVGPQAFFYIAPQLRQMELDADCCAVKLLRERHEAEGIEVARRTMASFGDEPTGAYYPTGNERAANIAACAGSSP